MPENKLLNSEIKNDTERYTEKRVLIAGWSRVAHTICDRILDQYTDIYTVIGFFNVYPVDQIGALSYRNIPLLSDFHGIDKVVSEYGCNHMIIAVDPHEYSKIHTLIEYCNLNGLSYELINERYDIIYGETLKYIAGEVLNNWDFSIHRFFELLFSVVLFILFIPLYIIVAIMVKIDSPGAILYSQERVGKDGKIFRIFKFRTMVQDAEKLSGPQLACKKDPRITRSGRFMRKTRLDEIPQLINIMLGDMSFIGPRPERPFFVDKYSRQIPFYKNRLKVKPGVTGIAQIKVGYDESIDDVMEKVKWDLYYIEHKSLWLNIKILFQTVGVLLTAQGQ